MIWLGGVRSRMVVGRGVRGSMMGGGGVRGSMVGVLLLGWGEVGVLVGVLVQLVQGHCLTAINLNTNKFNIFRRKDVEQNIFLATRKPLPLHSWRPGHFSFRHPLNSGPGFRGSVSREIKESEYNTVTQYHGSLLSGGPKENLGEGVAGSPSNMPTLFQNSHVNWYWSNRVPLGHTMPAPAGPSRPSLHTRYTCGIGI